MIEKSPSGKGGGSLLFLLHRHGCRHHLSMLTTAVYGVDGHGSATPGGGYMDAACANRNAVGQLPPRTRRSRDAPGRSKYWLSEARNSLRELAAPHAIQADQYSETLD